MKVIIHDLPALRSWVQSYIPELTKRQIILLEGQLGAGKTQLVRFLVEELKGEAVQSPTFAIHNSYTAGDRQVEHLDLYRLESEDDLESTGFWDLFMRPEGLIVIEWADRLEQSYLPLNWSCHKICLRILTNGERELEFIRRD